jgi:hypothetical protein
MFFHIYCIFSSCSVVLSTVMLSHIHISLMIYYYISCIYSYRLWNVICHYLHNVTNQHTICHNLYNVTNTYIHSPFTILSVTILFTLLMFDTLHDFCYWVQICHNLYNVTNKQTHTFLLHSSLINSSVHSVKAWYKSWLSFVCTKLSLFTQYDKLTNKRHIMRYRHSIWDAPVCPVNSVCLTFHW